MNWTPNVLVLGPGGIKGIIEIGAIMAIEEYRPKFIPNLNVICGVSIGAVIGLLITAGYTSNDILLDGMLIDLFRDISNISIQDVLSNQGVFSSEPIRERLTQRMTDKFGIVPSLQQLYMFTGIEFMTVTVGHKSGVLYLSYKNFPNLSVVEAVIRSINIPMAFSRLEIDNDVFIDGAFGNPYPVDQYDFGNNKILGVLICPADEEADKSEESPLSAIFRYLAKTLHSSIRALRESKLNGASSRCKHLILKWPSSFDPLGINLTNELRAKMLITGYQATQKFLGTSFKPEDQQKEKTD